LLEAAWDDYEQAQARDESPATLIDLDTKLISATHVADHEHRKLAEAQACKAASRGAAWLAPMAHSMPPAIPDALRLLLPTNAAATAPSAEEKR
jgi:hypothetical protein